MADLIAKDSWVEIERIELAPDERASHLPEDTRQVPLVMRVKGFLADPARMGAEAEIVTAAGRLQYGKLVAVNPAYDHGFGPPIPELSSIGREARAILRGEDS